MLLRAPSVVRELSLSREQAAVVAGFVEEAESPLWRLRDLPARERDIDLVRRKAGEAGIRYPVAVDNEARNWDAWANPTWPGVYLVDRNGFIRLWWYGELNWQQAQGESWMRTRITELIAEPASNSDGQAKESPGPSVQNALGPAGELSQ